MGGRGRGGGEGVKGGEAGRSQPEDVLRGGFHEAARQGARTKRHRVTEWRLPGGAPPIGRCGLGNRGGRWGGREGGAWSVRGEEGKREGWGSGRGGRGHLRGRHWKGWGGGGWRREGAGKGEEPRH